MSTDLMPVEQQTLPTIRLSDIKGQVEQIEQCIKSLMHENLHYGKIAGCGDKPTLLKPGAEMLAKLFQLRPEYIRDRMELPNNHIEISVTCKMFSRATGKPVGEGSGICSTMESKYRYRTQKRSCPSCGVEGSIMRSKYPDKQTGEKGWYCRDCKTNFSLNDESITSQQLGKVENPDIADTYNTVSKMADKRAYVAAVITTVGASDFVTQDIEDFADYSPVHQPVETTAEVITDDPGTHHDGQDATMRQPESGKPRAKAEIVADVTALLDERYPKGNEQSESIRGKLSVAIFGNKKPIQMTVSELEKGLSKLTDIFAADNWMDIVDGVIQNTKAKK